jgi:exodeoxyribonuclease V gamma subunit
MFRLVTANDTARLADALGEQLRGPRDNPLVPARVLVPQAGLKRWLQVYLAERLGVVANLEFTPPAQFAWELLRAARPDLPQHSPFDVEVLRWHVYALLGGLLDGRALAPLRAYLQADGDPLRRFALSFELARAYERMQGYRRKQLLAWERGADAGDWQAELWRGLLPRVGGVSRAARVDEWLRASDPEYAQGEFTDKPAPPGLPARFACFACANVSPDVLRMLAVAGRHADVDFFLPLPSMEYLGDLPRTRAAVRERLGERNGENPLVVSLGGALSEFVELLFGYEHVQPDVEHDDYDDEIPRTTLLGRVRDDILKHAAPPREDDRTALPDDSLQFHACHTPLREVQTLHDTLLAMFEKHNDLQPRNVAVMMPDVAAYRPAIEAVFGGIDRHDPRFILFNLGNGAATVVHPVVDLFLKLLDAPTSRWEAGDLLDVLAASGVMRCFELDADALERLTRRVRDAGVRWGEDERARADCGGYREFSWAFGIDRMLAGFACGDLDDALVRGTAPLAGVEGAAFAQLDAVLAVTETWRTLRDASRQARTARAWQRMLNAALDSLYQPDPRDVAETRALERVRDTLTQLARDCGQVDPDLELPWADARAFLREQLAAPDPQQYLFTGGVTFCGMVPLRVVPFRVICLLGMDEDAFPRREPGGLDPLTVDRRANRAERGDRDVRADDRLLFLQLLAAARDAFYVSWVGRDAHNNASRPPSAVVAELMEVVRKGYLQASIDEAARAAQNALLPQVQPLHPFDPKLFDPQTPWLQSFRAEWLPAARAPQRTANDLPAFAAQPLPAPETRPDALDLDRISLDDLQRFFDDPARGFLEHALQLRLPHNAEQDADLEPLQPDAPLLRYRLTHALLEHDDAESESVETWLRARAELPPGELAEAALETARGRAGALREAIAAFTGGAARADDIAATLELDDGTLLTGTVTNVYPQGLVRYSPGGFRGRRVLREWLDTLFASLARDASLTCRFLWIEQKKLHARDLFVAGSDEASARLTSLITAYRDGQCRPLALFPDASAIAFKLHLQKAPLADDQDREKFVDALAGIASRVDDNGDFASASDFDKPSVRIAWRGVALGNDDATLAASLHDTARALFPRLHVVSKGRP